MANERLIDRPFKTSPVGADTIYVADSQGSPVGNEVQVSITDLVNSIDFVTEPVDIPDNHIPIAGAGQTIVDSGISVDGSQNVTGVNTIQVTGAITSGSQLATKTYVDTKLAIASNLSDLNNASTARTNLGLGQAAVKNVTDNTKTVVASITGSFTTNDILLAADTNGTIKSGGAGGNFLLKANNLSDVNSAQTSFNNISPLNSKGDILSYSGTNNIRVPVGTDGYVITADSTQTAGWKWSPASQVSGFLDNTIFNSSFGIAIPTTPGPLPAGDISSFTPGSSWTAVGDYYGMRCGQTGSYWCKADLPLGATGLGGGRTYFYIVVNGAQRSKLFPMSNLGTQPQGGIVLWATVNGILNLNSGDVVEIFGVTDSVNPLAIYYNPGESDGMSVSFIRLT